MTPDDEDDIKVLQETAHILVEAASDRDIGVIVATLRYLQERDGDVTKTALQEALPEPLPTREALRLIRHLRQKQYIGPDAVDSRTESLHQIESLVEVLQTRNSEPETDILATVPDDGAIDASEFGNLLSEVMEVIKKAESQLWLVSPFLSEPAFNRLEPALRTAVDRGATINLLTRYLTYGDENAEYNRTFAQNVLDNTHIAPHSTIYEYVDEETWVTFHAKVIIADEKEAYLGTANVTGTGFLTNLELGAIFRDETVSDLSALFDSLRQSEHLYEVERVGDSFRRVDD